MLDQDVVLQHRELGVVVMLTNEHDTVDRFPASQELSLGEDRCTVAPGGASLTPALLLRLKTGRAIDARDLIGDRPARLTHPHRNVTLIVVVSASIVHPSPTPAPPTVRAADGLGAGACVIRLIRLVV